MKRYSWAFAGLLAFVAASSRGRADAVVLSGLDVLGAKKYSLLKGKTVGVITNQTGRDRDGVSMVELLGKAPGVTLSAIFSPEHGFTGSIEAGDAAASSVYKLGDGRSVPIYSLYKGGLAGMRPKEEELKGLDALVFDIQDAGARFYTYPATMAMAMEEAQKHKLEFFVLDRPNPVNGVTIEGPVAEDMLRGVTSVTYFKEPVRHGLTVGEIATMYAKEIGYAKLTVVKMRGWRREMWYDQTGLPWIAPSPNLPDLDSAALYPGVAVFEASNLSVGRGTPSPFRWVGAPWLDAAAVVEELKRAGLEGVDFSVADYTPTKDPFTGTPCRGVLVRVADRERARPLAVFAKLYRAVRRANPGEVKWDATALQRMIGTSKFQPLADADDSSAEAIQGLLDQGPKDFAAARKPCLLY